MADQPGIRDLRANDGARLEYEVLGAGPPLVLLHGVLASRATFSRQLAALAPYYRLILPSFRGHDGSDTRIPPGYGAGGSDVDDLIAVLAAENVERCHLLGHSSGGATAFAFARRHPERVGRLILIEPTLLRLLAPAGQAAHIPPFAAIADAADAGGPEAGLRAAMAFLGGDAWRGLEADKQAARLAAMAGPGRVLVDLDVTATDHGGGRRAQCASRPA